jgi:hypothetical protein
MSTIASGRERRQRWAGRLAWGLWAVCLLLQTTTIAIAYLGRSYPGDPADLPLFIRFAVYLPIIIAFPSIGALIAVRQPRNPIGWLFLAWGFVVGVAGFAEAYWRYVLFVRPGALPGGELMVWINVRPYPIAWGVVFALLVLLFPTGRPPSRGWWVVGWVIMLGGLIQQAALAFLPGPLAQSVTITNPLGLSGAAPFLQLSANLGSGMLLLGMLGAVLSVLTRLRRAQGIERQQVKWFASALVLNLATSTLFFYSVQLPLIDVLQALAGALVAVAAGIAILRHHLFDIDLIIRRTLVYAVVSATLASIYFGAVVTLQALFVRLTGQESTVAVVASTLAIAALFGPLRAWVQAQVDRRFDRTRYDARLVLEQFAARAQREAELDALSADLLATVDETLKPERATLWLKRR